MNSNGPPSLQELRPTVISLPHALPALVTIEVKQIDTRGPATRYLIGAALMNPNPWGKTSVMDIPFEMIT
jgi:hypothetical protein